MAEFPHLGIQCCVSSCSQLDFLPFVCDACEQRFCLEHRTQNAHGCIIKKIEDVRPSFHGSVNGLKCFVSSCTNTCLAEILCLNCSHNFCVSHRHRQDHDCPKQECVAKPKVTVPTLSVGNTGVKPVTTTCKGAKSTKTSAQVALMKLKMKAEGDASISIQDRIYLQIMLPNENNRILYFSKGMKLGKIIDMIAIKENLVNYNNISCSKKLRFISEEVQLPTDITLEEAVSNQLIKNGGDVVLKYADD